LLDSVRALHDATDLDRQRVLQKLEARLPFLAVGSVAAAAVAAHSGTALAQGASAVGKGVAATSLTGGLLVAKVATVVAVASVGGAVAFGVGFYAGRTTGPEPLPDGRQVAPSHSAQVGQAAFGARLPKAGSTAAPELEPVEIAPSASATAPVARLPTFVSGDARSASTESAEPQAAPRAASTADGATLADETALLRRAHRALQEGMPSVALLSMDELVRRYPKTSLLEEANVVRALALCDQGKTAQASAIARAILARNPHSVHAARLKKSCALAEEPDESG
jgi:hypothetical protein